MIKLSNNFKLKEFLRSDTADKYGLDNRISMTEIERLYYVAQSMERVRILLGDTPIIITSGYRSPELNRKIGGSLTSDHVLGYAVDFTHRLKPSEIIRIISNSDLEYDQLIDEFGRWVHISFNPRYRRQNLRASVERGKTVYRGV